MCLLLKASRPQFPSCPLDLHQSVMLWYCTCRPTFGGTVACVSSGYIRCPHVLTYHGKWHYQLKEEGSKHSGIREYSEYWFVSILEAKYKILKNEGNKLSKIGVSKYISWIRVWRPAQRGGVSVRGGVYMETRSRWPATHSPLNFRIIFDTH